MTEDDLTIKELLIRLNDEGYPITIRNLHAFLREGRGPEHRKEPHPVNKIPSYVIRWSDALVWAEASYNKNNDLQWHPPQAPQPAAMSPTDIFPIEALADILGQYIRLNHRPRWNRFSKSLPREARVPKLNALTRKLMDTMSKQLAELDSDK